MMKPCVLTLLAFLGFTLTLGQNVNLEWAGQFNGGDDELGYSIAVDAQGNVYTFGEFEFLVDFDPGPGTAGMAASGHDRSIFVSKLDANGNYVWAKKIWGLDPLAVHHGIVDPGSGHVYLTGTFSGGMDVDPDTSTFIIGNIGDPDAFLVKLATDGTFQWARQWTSTRTIASSALATDPAGNLYIVGRFEGTGDFDPSPANFDLTSAGVYDGFVVKLDALGDLVWAKQLEGLGEGDAYQVAVDAMGGVYVTGGFEGTVDFDPGPGTTLLSATPGRRDAYVLKLDSTGSLVWVSQFGGNEIYARSIAVADGPGAVYVGGGFSGTNDFDPTAGTYTLNAGTDTNSFLLKLDPGGTLAWARHFTDSVNQGASVGLDAAGNVYMAGTFQGTVDFNPAGTPAPMTSTRFMDAYVVSLDATGALRWAKAFGGYGDDVPYSLAVSPAGAVHTTGSFTLMPDFDPNSGVYNLTAAQLDVFVHKMGTAGLGVEDSPLDLRVYPNPSTGTVTVHLGQVTPLGTIRVVDMLGKTHGVWATEGAASIRLDLQDLPNGIYLLDVKADGTAAAVRLVKE